jgi:hypothetical protein
MNRTKQPKTFSSRTESIVCDGLITLAEAIGIKPSELYTVLENGIQLNYGKDNYDVVWNFEDLMDSIDLQSYDKNWGSL